MVIENQVVRGLFHILPLRLTAKISMDPILLSKRVFRSAELCVNRSIEGVSTIRYYCWQSKQRTLVKAMQK
jgi:hypothetical protein